MARIDALFRRVMELEASDLHLVAGLPARFRIFGDLATGFDQPFDDPTCREFLLEICPPHLSETFLAEKDLDFAYSLPGVGRFRCNYFFQENGVGGVFRLIPEHVPPFDELGLPESVEKLAHLDQGLVLVTGPTGSGKSTTLATLIDLINSTYAKHIITVEDPIEFVHLAKRSVITQREVGANATSFATAVRAAMRADPDVLLVGEMRDTETVTQALTAAEAGVLVFATLHTNNAANTMDRIVDLFPAEAQDQARAMLAESLMAIVSQLLIRKEDGLGRVPATEVLLRASGLANVIREGKPGMIQNYIQAGKSEGMESMDDSLIRLVRLREVAREEAFRRAQNRQAFAEALGMRL
jgi:twitching motility protein PilT